MRITGSNSVVRGETGESKLAVLGFVQRGNPLDKTGKELSWQGEEHAKLEMREFRNRDSGRNYSSIPLHCIENSRQFSLELIYNY